VLLAADDINAKLQRSLENVMQATRIRIHGDYHLGQVLHTGRDFIIIDFEGEPNRPLSQRRTKRCPLVDVAGMIRSFSYAATWALHQGTIRPEDLPELESWADSWYRWVAASYLRAYLEAASGAAWLPQEQPEMHRLLEIFLLEKAAYELGYELGHRPDWVSIPLRGMLDLLEEE
jgi:maltose alpha-D-glucosyltransferase/alpha-amylase